MVGAEVKRRPRHTGVRSSSEPIFSRLFNKNCGESEHSLFSNTTQCSNNRKVVEARLSFVCTRYAGAQEGGTTSDAKRNLEVDEASPKKSEIPHPSQLCKASLSATLPQGEGLWRAAIIRNSVVTRIDKHPFNIFTCFI